MRRIISGTGMKEVDNYTINEVGVPSLVLMERAALEVYDAVEDFTWADSSDRKILVVCGVGNNGADGLAFARILYLNDGIRPDIYIIGNEDKATAEFNTQKNITVEKLGCRRIYNIEEFMEYDIIVDALFGIGLKRDVTGKFADVINMMNKAAAENNTAIISVDVPSGIDADTAGVRGCAVRAEITVTFGAMKTGLILYPGAEYAGDVRDVDIGFPKEAFDRLPEKCFTYELEDLELMPPRRDDSNKGTYGKILVVAGSAGMSGAAYMSAKAAFRSGAGLIRIFTSEKNRTALAKIIPEAIIETYGAGFDIDKYKNAIEWADVIVVGPGIGKCLSAGSVQTILTEFALKSGKPVVIDADALNTISKNGFLAELYHDKCIVTPHIGEMSRLTGMSVGDIKSDIAHAAADYAAKHNVTCVLKDARTVVAAPDGRCYYNTSGNNGMATAGSGDVLTGIIAAMAGSGMSVFEAACMGVFLHGLAGDNAAERLGKYSMMATDIIDGAANVLKNQKKF